MKKSSIRILILLCAAVFIGTGCMEQYAGNPQLGALYRVLNYRTTFKERTLLFEMEDHGVLASEGKFYIMGGGISNPGAYVCSQNESIITAIEKAGQTASYSDISFTLIKGIRENEREMHGIVMASASSGVPTIEPGDLICLSSKPSTIALSQK